MDLNFSFPVYSSHGMSKGMCSVVIYSHVCHLPEFHTFLDYGHLNLDLQQLFNVTILIINNKKFICHAKNGQNTQVPASPV